MLGYDQVVMSALGIAIALFVTLLTYIVRRELSTLRGIELEGKTKDIALELRQDQMRQEPYWQRKYEDLLKKYENREREKPKNDEQEIVGLTDDGEMIFKEKNDGRADALF